MKGIKNVALGLWDPRSKLGSSRLSNSLITGIYPAASARRHVLMFPLDFLKSHLTAAENLKWRSVHIVTNLKSSSRRFSSSNTYIPGRFTREPSQSLEQTNEEDCMPTNLNFPCLRHCCSYAIGFKTTLKWKYVMLGSLEIIWSYISM